MAPDILTVGGATVSVDAAKAFAQRYLNSPSEFWAYPAYDSYPGGAGRKLSEQDLLAPILLNVQHLSLSAYYALVGALPRLNSVMDRLGDELTLVEASETDLANIAEVFSVLDPPGIPGVQLTTLSKILHRMRPCLIPCTTTTFAVATRRWGALLRCPW